MHPRQHPDFGSLVALTDGERDDRARDVLERAGGGDQHRRVGAGRLVEVGDPEDGAHGATSQFDQRSDVVRLTRADTPRARGWLGAGSGPPTPRATMTEARVTRSLDPITRTGTSRLPSWAALH